MADEMKPVAWRVRPRDDKVWHLTDDPAPNSGYEREPLYSATTLATLQAAILEKDAEIASLTVERDNAVAPYAAAISEAAKLRDRVEEQRRTIVRYMGDDVFTRAARAEATVARLQAERDGDVAKAVAIEREACAVAAEDHGALVSNERVGKACSRNIAKAIRTRPALTGESDED